MDDKALIETLYFRLLDSWNKMDAHQFAELFTDNANVTGFDGSQMNGREDIEKQVAAIFTDHKVASYVGIVREVRLLAPGVAVLRAVAGMRPPGQENINPKTNAIQTMIAERSGDNIRISIYQNTPAAFHGRPELVDELTNELNNR